MESHTRAASPILSKAISSTIQLYDFISSNVIVLLAVAAILLVLSTRLSSNGYGTKAIEGKNVTTVPIAPYWIPFLGHLPDMAWDATAFTRRLRSTYVNGAYSLVLGGSVHNILYTPGLVTALFHAKESKVAHDDMSKHMLDVVFGFPMKGEKDVYEAAFPELMACYRHLLSEPSLGEMVDRTSGKVRETISNLVSFSPSLVDQAQWERTSRAEVKTDGKGDTVMEVNMLDLVRDWCATSANPSLIGTNFLAKYPEFFADIWTHDRAFLLLAAGLPRWVPIRSVTQAHIARRRILQSLKTFHEAMDKHVSGMDPGAEWRDLDDVGPLVKDRVTAYRKHNMSMEGRAALEHALLWATNANSNTLVFWMLNRIYADKELLEEIRAEFAPYLKAMQPKQVFPIPEPPRLETCDVEGLCSSCPLLKSCYVECLRVDAASWSFKVVKEDFVLSGREKDSTGFFLKKGQFVHAAHDLHNTNPDYFPDPDEWRADRHIKQGADSEKRTAEMGTIRPYGGGSGMCKGRAFAYKECMLFTAAILSMWDMEPVGGEKWKMPSHKKATGVYNTSDSARVWVKRRKLPTVG